MKLLLSVVLAMASLLAHAAPMRYTFYDCGADPHCTAQPPTVLTQFRTPGVIQAPAVPPPGNVTPVEEVLVDEVLQGSFGSLGIFTFNTNNAIGSLLVFRDLVTANGRPVGPVSAIGAAFPSALLLNWVEGSIFGFGLVNCFNLNCTRQTTIQTYVSLVAQIDNGPPTNVPEPGALALAGLALGLGAASRRFGGRRRVQVSPVMVAARPGTAGSGGR